MSPSKEHTSAAPQHALEQYSVQPQAQKSGDESPYFNSTAPTISLPKGGGALKGIDEKFSVNAVNGTAGLQLALPLTPGRSGFTPALSLSYNSGSGNSPFGLGWSLGLPSIRRRTDNQLPLYNDDAETDVFLLAGAEDLVPQLYEATPGGWLHDEAAKNITIPTGNVTELCLVKRYRPRIEGLFARIEHIRSLTKGSWWRVTTKDNITTWYGLTPAARIADPSDANRIFEWLPQLVVDGKGNVQQYVYKAENFDNVPVAASYERNRNNGIAACTNRYLKAVRYCNLTPFTYTDQYAPALPATADNFLMEAVLDYGEHTDNDNPGIPTYRTPEFWGYRPDPFSDYRAGFEIRTWRRCGRVLMFHRFEELDGGEPVIVRSLDLSYGTGGGTTLAEASFITSVTQTGYMNTADGWQRKSLPAMTMDYQPLQWDDTLHTVAPEDAINAPQGLTGPYQWTDLWGEGLPGILTEQGDCWWYKSNLGGGHFSPAMAVAEKPSFSLAGRGGISLELADLDADGRKQAVARGRGVEGYFELDEDDQHWQAFRAFKETARVNWSSPHMKLLDLDGDGRPDLLLTDDRVWSWYKNKGTEGFEPGGQTSTVIDEERGPRLVLRDDVQSIFLADMSGDGLTDLVRIRNGEVCYWPNLGWGRFGARVSMSGAPLFDTPDLFNPLYLQLADISGTGAADIVYLGHSTFRAWVNLSGNGFSEAHDIATLPGIEPYSKVGVMDFLGNGTGCVVWSSPLPQHSAAPLRYIDLMGGVKPYLLNAYHNGMGKTVSLHYKSSTQYYLADKAAGTPWATKLPFPVQCIESTTTTDAVSETSYTQEYSYHHGYYDHAEREFRGFGRVETTDTDTAAYYSALNTQTATLQQAPVLTKTWYHTGAWIKEGSLLDAFAAEYFQFSGWNALPTQAVFELPAGAPDIALLEREAHRAMKGSALRQEVYALDGSAKEDKPYTVTVSAYRVLMVQPRRISPTEVLPHASLRTEGLQTLSWSCEREPADARLSQSLTLETDRWGNVTQSAQVVYPRATPDTALPSLVQTEQARMHISCSVTVFTNDIGAEALSALSPESAAYRLRLPSEAKSYELSGYTAPAGLWTPAALKTALVAAAEIDYSASFNTSLLQKRLLSHTRSLFAADANFDQPLAAGVLQSLGIPYEHYTLAFTGATRTALYGTHVDNAMLAEGGYVQTGTDGRWWIPSGTVQYGSTPAARFYMPAGFTDPWTNYTELSYWEAGSTQYWLLPYSTTDALGNTSVVNSYDWRTLQPTQLQDANLNLTNMAYDALGRPTAMALCGKENEAFDQLLTADGNSSLLADIYDDAGAQAAFWDATESGDLDDYAAALLGRATWRCIYRLGEDGPAAVAMIAREQHYSQNSNSPLLIRITYTDGLGRVAMMKARAADRYDPVEDKTCPCWIGSGKTAYNNKGKAVLQYEPYFTTKAHYDVAYQIAAIANSPQLRYDPLGRLYRTDMPDGTFSYTEWDNWSQTVWDASDTVLDSEWYAARTGSGALTSDAGEADAAAKAAEHAGTPALMYLDSLTRPFYTVQHNSTPGTGTSWTDSYIHSHETLDITGSRIEVIDGRGLLQLGYRYNMVKAPGYQYSMDGGEGHMLADAGGQPLYHWDAEDRRFRSTYDALRRPLEQQLTMEVNKNLVTLTLARTVYGETITPMDFSQLYNVRGRAIASYDGSGKHYVAAYDFKGNPVESFVRLLADPALADADWNVLTDSDLDTEVFGSTVTVDALNRPLSITDPGGNVTLNTYEKDGALKTVDVNSEPYVQDIHHNAKGQREAIWYGNATKTSYEYDELSHRLSRLLTVNLNTNDTVQDLNYYYDPVGNITTITDAAQQTVFYNNCAVSPDMDYTYDALYQLVRAEGRESVNNPEWGISSDIYNDSHAFVRDMAPWDGSTSALRRYVQKYRYDEAGNILELKHIAGGGTTGSYTRTYAYGAGGSGNNSRLWNTQVGSNNPYSYNHDLRGNMCAMPHLSHMDYDALNQMSHVLAGTKDAYYQYSGGQRIRKHVAKGDNITEQRIYMVGWERYRRRQGNDLIVERDTVHVSDGQGRIAMLEVRTAGDGGQDNDTEQSLKRFIYSNHLGSSALELDEQARIISYEEYYPYGTTAYQGMNSDIKATAKRYRFTGKERDEESGLNYHGARYYAPWLARWCAVDPKQGERSTLSPYNYCQNNPLNRHDPDGMKDEKNEKHYRSDPNAWTAVNPNQNFTVPATDDVVYIEPNKRTDTGISGSAIEVKERLWIKTEQLETLFPNGDKNTLAVLKDVLNEKVYEYGINTERALSHFLAQAGEETGGFHKAASVENLNYPEKGLLKTFGKYFSETPTPNKLVAKEFAHKPEDIANIVYADRMGNGNSESRDGWNFRGRGVFQITGHNNYQDFQNFYNTNNSEPIDILSKPELIATDKTLAIVSALWFFKTKVADKLKLNQATVEQVTMKVNGGDNGLEGRKAYFKSATTIFGR